LETQKHVRKGTTVHEFVKQLSNEKANKLCMKITQEYLVSGKAYNFSEEVNLYT